MLDDKYQAYQKTSKDVKEYFSFLLPLYEQEYDLASFAFVGKNGIKIILIKIPIVNPSIKLLEIFH
jgi:hypothetical protein